MHNLILFYSIQYNVHTTSQVHPGEARELYSKPGIQPILRDLIAFSLRAPEKVNKYNPELLNKLQMTQVC